MNLKHFIIGSSLPIFILHFYLVFNNKNKNYSFFLYTIIAPLFIGLMNIFKHKLFNRKYINNLYF